jgi:hypothetical protein
MYVKNEQIKNRNPNKKKLLGKISRIKRSKSKEANPSLNSGYPKSLDGNFRLDSKRKLPKPGKLKICFTKTFILFGLPTLFEIWEYQTLILKIQTKV